MQLQYLEKILKNIKSSSVSGKGNVITRLKIILVHISFLSDEYFNAVKINRQGCKSGSMKRSEIIQ